MRVTLHRSRLKPRQTRSRRWMLAQPETVRAERGTKYDTDVVAACMILHKHGGLQPLIAH